MTATGVCAPPAEVGGWPVLRGWARSSAHALLELQTAAGSRGAEWFADADRARETARQVPGSQVLDSVLVHPTGQDHRLPGLAPRLAAGHQVVAHRPGRRAVLRTPDGMRFTKVTRKRRAVEAVARHRAVQHVSGQRVRIAPILEHSPDAVTLAALPGSTLLDLGADLGVSDSELAGCWHALGHALRALHRTGFDRRLGLDHSHDAATEMRTTRSWLDPVLAWGLLPGVPEPILTALLEPLVSGPVQTFGVLHRDLHDQQVLVHPGEPAGLLDLDTAAWGEPALDVANVLVHLDLRVRQDLLTPWRAAAARDAFLGALEPSATTRSRVAAYQVAARLRLAAVYALRPRWRRMAHDLLADTLP